MFSSRVEIRQVCASSCLGRLSILQSLTTVATAIRYLIIETAPESFELDNLPHASSDTPSSSSTLARNLIKTAQRLSKPKRNDTASNAKNPFDLQTVFPALRFAIVKPERKVNRGPYYREVEATACDVYCYGKSKWEEVSLIMASSTAANRYLSDPSLSNSWYYDRDLIPTEKERQGIRNVVVRPGGTLIAAPFCRKEHHYRHFVLPNLLCIRVAAGLANQDEDALKACVEQTIPWYLSAVEGCWKDMQWCNLQHNLHVRMKASYRYLPWLMAMVSTSMAPMNAEA
jgi:uncharacterized protein YraI